MADIDNLTNPDLADWIELEFAKPATENLQTVLDMFGGSTNEAGTADPIEEARNIASDVYWTTIITADDQLRQRVAYALSQILVISHSDFMTLTEAQGTVVAYMDILSRNAFGNYRDLLEEVTYSVAMAEFLTYLANLPPDMEEGRVPDENYAREIMQLFTIGLVELNQDGTPRLVNGETVETYDNTDVTGLAKVFTGLSFDDGQRFFRLDDVTALHQPLAMFNNFHAPQEKTFLGTTIPPNTSGEQSIDIALDTLIDHPNTPPFVSRQLIQRLVTSNPSPAYVERVANAFASGTFTADNGTTFGDGRRGDMQATIAAILLDDDARDESARSDPTFGKIKEPVLRFTHWARAFGVDASDPGDQELLFNAGSPALLGQHPYKANSVFNFYRPGYVAPGTQTGNAGLVAPELQISNDSSVIGYANFITFFILGETPTESGNQTGFIGNYASERAIAGDAQALVDRLDLLLASGNLTEATKTRIVTALEEIPGTTDDELNFRTILAIIMVMTTPDYLVQR